jgi:hypothetical protein
MLASLEQVGTLHSQCTLLAMSRCIPVGGPTLPLTRRHNQITQHESLMPENSRWFMKYN